MQALSEINKKVGVAMTCDLPFLMHHWRKLPGREKNEEIPYSRKKLWFSGVGTTVLKSDIPVLYTYGDPVPNRLANTVARVILSSNCQI